MKKLYLTRREDFFEAMAKGMISTDCVHKYSSIWMILSLTPEQKNNYTYPICDL